MSISIENIRFTVNMARNKAANNVAQDRVATNLRAAIRHTEEGNYKDAERAIENAEAWLAYLRDPSIIDQPERNLPA